MSLNCPHRVLTAIDLELVGQRVLKLAEIAVLEHLEMLDRSQAGGIMDLLLQSEAQAPLERQPEV